MLASITERTREIGIRRALGAKRPAHHAAFLSRNKVISLTGGLIGIALGHLGRHAAADGRANCFSNDTNYRTQHHDRSVFGSSSSRDRGDGLAVSGDDCGADESD